MYVEQILALMRMTESGEEVIANLAKMILLLVEQLREFEARAGLAEAALEAKDATLTAVQAITQRLTDADDVGSRQKIIRELAEAMA